MKQGLLISLFALVFFTGADTSGCSSSNQPAAESGDETAGNEPEKAGEMKWATVESKTGIHLVTKGAKPLYKDIHSACVVDIFYTRGNQSRDILSDPYFSFIRSLNFKSLQYSGGSTADHDHVIIGDTRITGGKGDGYNISEEDLKTRGEDINTVLDGVGAMRFGKDFFNEYCALLNKLEIHGDVIANVQGGTLEELYWKIEQAHAKRVIFGMEQNLQGNARDYPDGNTYRNKISQWIEAVEKKYPGIITVVDAAPVYRPNARFNSWNEQLKGIPGDEVRLYLWDKDFTTWSPDAEANFSTMNQAFTSTIPQWFEKVQERFPGKKVSVWQWGLKPKTDLYNTMAGCLYIGRFYEFMIEYNQTHDNFIGYAAFMSLKSLNRGDGAILNHYHALKTCGMLFRGNKRVLEVTITDLPGVSGIACDENGTFSLLLINQSGTEVKVPSITIDQVLVQGKKYNVTSVSASAPSSTQVKTDSGTMNEITLKPFSLNVVEF